MLNVHLNLPKHHIKDYLKPMTMYIWLNSTRIYSVETVKADSFLHL